MYFSLTHSLTDGTYVTDGVFPLTIQNDEDLTSIRAILILTLLMDRRQKLIKLHFLHKK